MASDITGTAADFDHTVAFEVKVPDDGDSLNAASVVDGSTTPKTGFYPSADAVEFFRKVILGTITAKAFYADGTGGVVTATTAGDVAGSHDLIAGHDVAAGNIVIGDLGVTATTGNVTASAGNVVATVGNVTAGGLLSAATARSSATGGSGQSVAAGAIYKDTTCFAWGKVTVNGGGGTVTLNRSANVASVAYTATGIYTVTLQTAATNLLSIQVTPFDNQALVMVIDTATPPTTTVFRVLSFNVGAVVVATDPNANGGFFFEVKQG